MIEHVIEASIRNRFLVLMLGAALALAGVYAMLHTPVDAIPDLSENQVIVFTDWLGRSPREVEDQITYPLSLKLRGLAGMRAVRSSSEFNFSMITLIFADDIDFYFARQRVTEKLAEASTFLPPGVIPYMAPDATALGQIFWYTVETGRDSPVDSGRLWALNKFYIAPQLNAAAGVADVADVGGTPLEYQIDVRPEALRAYDITLGELYAAVAKSNLPAGGGVVQKNNAEYIVRGLGWIKDKTDIENTVIKEINRTPIYVKTIARVQLGTQFRRGVYEKDGDEMVGGVVLMRHGENPLAVTERVKRKIQDIQPGLPAGVHVVPAYDRTRLIRGAIHTLSEVMWHEMLIASLAILLILSHLRSVFVICLTLPLAVLFSFLTMWLLRVAGIIDIQANIMSLAGITISIGILVDQAIVMVENATHALKERFGDQKVTGDIRELVIPACRTVGRPVFFSVMIMLVSFIPVFMLSGREGKYFHPLAFTKSFALVGVALLSITLVPALIPTFIKGRLRSEEENWIVRGFINIYKPLLTWALPRRNLVMWMFAALLILAAGMFPLQAIIGQGASESAWRQTFLGVFCMVTSLTVLAIRGFHWQMLSLASLVLLALWAYHFSKIGVAFMPALDEGTTLDMPVTVPRASITQAADDLKARDALLRGFPEVESVIGKAGRANTPTDPSPLDMVETFVNFRPKDLWPKRVLRFDDARRQTEATLDSLGQLGYVASPKPQAEGPTPEEDRAALVNDATQRALERFDETLRELALLRYVEFESDLERELTLFAVRETLRRIAATTGHQESNGDLKSWTRPNPALAPKVRHSIAQGETFDVARFPAPKGQRSLAVGASPRETRENASKAAQRRRRSPDSPSPLRGFGREGEPFRGLAPTAKFPRRYAASLKKRATSKGETPGSAALHPGPSKMTPSGSAEALIDELTKSLTLKYGRWLAKNPALEDVTRLSREVAQSLKERGLIDDAATALERNDSGWAIVKSGMVELLGGERPDFARKLLAAVERRRHELWRERVKHVNWELFDRGTEAYCWYAWQETIAAAGRAGWPADVPRAAEQPFVQLRERLLADFKKRVFFWPRQTGPKGDLVDDEMGRVLQVPGWSNIFTQPIINRIEMLSTGVRTDIGVKVFGADLDTIDRVCKQVEAALKPINGARDVIAAPFMGKGYLEVDIDRESAARYGISVEDIENEIEVALAGKAITYTVEARERFPVRIRYARSEREDEESVRRLLVSPSGMGGTGGSAGQAMNTAERTARHPASPGHAARGKTLIPLSAVANVRVTGGPAMIKSENSRLVNYVTLNVRGRDVVGFVDEARRVVAQKVKLPEGVHVEWSGEFEHQVRAAKTLRVVFPVVIALIFIILYLTYNDLMDAALMMLAVPEALAGGAFFMYLFPKITRGWDAPPLDFSVAVWVGFIACFGMATETGIIMLVYLREAIEKRGGLENIQSLAELRQAVIEGAVHRLRPKLLTEGVAIIAIFPMVFAQGVGGEILAPMALPVLGGLLISDEVVDLFLPVRFYWVRRGRWLKLRREKRRAASLND